MCSVWIADLDSAELAMGSMSMQEITNTKKVVQSWLGGLKQHLIISKCNPLCMANWWIDFNCSCTSFIFIAAWIAHKSCLSNEC